MSKRRTITLTETEYEAIISAFAVWYGNTYEEASSEWSEFGTPIPRDIRETNRALERIRDKWWRAGR